MRPGEGSELARLMLAQLFFWAAGLMVGAGARLALGLRKH